MRTLGISFYYLFIFLLLLSATSSLYGLVIYLDLVKVMVFGFHLSLTFFDFSSNDMAHDGLKGDARGGRNPKKQKQWVNQQFHNRPHPWITNNDVQPEMLLNISSALANNFPQALLNFPQALLNLSPALLNNVSPAVLNTQLALMNSVQPALPNNLQSALSNNVQPALPNNLQSALSNNVQPALPNNLQSALSNNVQPIVEKKRRPALLPTPPVPPLMNKNPLGQGLLDSPKNWETMVSF